MKDKLMSLIRELQSEDPWPIERSSDGTRLTGTNEEMILGSVVKERKRIAELLQGIIDSPDSQRL